MLSAQNRRLERVHELLSPRGRREQGRFAFEGPTLLDEALRSDAELLECYVSESALKAHERSIDALESRGIPTYAIPERAFARLSDLESPTGLLTVATSIEAQPGPLLARSGPVVLLAAVNDPGNAGTLVRTAEAFGAAGVLFGAGGVDPLSPKVVRAAMGSLFRLPFARIESEEVSSAAATAHRPIVAMALEGVSLTQAALDDRAIVAIGNERHGVASWLPHWDAAIRIDQSGPTESLNAAIAGAIVLYELARRRV